MLIRTISISRPLSVQIRKVGTLRHWRVLSSICFRFGHTLGARAYVLSVSYLVGFVYAIAPWGVCSEGLPVRVVRRRATLPHPVGCSTIAVPGLSFRVRNGTGRLTWAMAAANLLLYGQTLGSAGLWRPGNRTADADMSMFRLVARQCSLPSGAVCRRKMRSNRQGLECWCCLSSVSTGRLHPSRGFHVRPIDHVFCMGTTGTRRFHGMLILEQASRLDAFSGYPFRT